MDTVQDLHETTRDEYSLKAGSVLACLENFGTLFGLKLGYLLFGALEETSKALQAKDTSMREALLSARLLVSFIKRQRTDSSLEFFFASVQALAAQLNINPPTLPQYRPHPRHLDDGEEAHKFDSPKMMFQQIYFEACYLLMG